MKSFYNNNPLCNLVPLVVLFSLILSIIDKRTYCFNIEERKPIVKYPPDGIRGWYFGFSVAQHKTAAQSTNIEDNWILVGAPLGQNLQPETNHSGALFKCPITKDSPRDCIQVRTDGKRFTDFDYSDNPELETRDPEILDPPGKDEIKDGQWLGVSVKSQKPGGNVMVCAHRYIQSPNIKLEHYGMGLCYVLNQNLEAVESLEPCKGRPMEKLHQQYGYCQVGTSLALLEDGFALMGTPGPYTWRGTIFGRVVVGNFLDLDSTIYRGPLNDDPEPIDKYSYLGMSVTAGYFFNKTGRHFASGAPRSKDCGEVLFFEKTRNVEELKIVYRIKGEQFASSFGYEILSTDLNQDGFDDLLVAAPFYYEGDKYGGAVYVYTNLRSCLEDVGNDCRPSLKLRGSQESRFGFAMTSIGDINKDGFNDVAIGAPYTKNGGAIHIYLSSPNGLSHEPSQIIQNRELSTLGYSLSGGLDMDNNGYPDLLVGNYEDDMVILFKTRPVIDISITIRGDELNNINASQGCKHDPRRENSCFTFMSCFVISDNSKKFDVRYEIKEIDTRLPRTYFWKKNLPYSKDASFEDTVKVDGSRKEYCQEHRVYIREGIGDILSPINYFVNYTLAYNEVDSPILNKTSTKNFKAAFQKSCGEDDICESKLIMQATADLNRTDEGFILDLGQHQEFILDVNIENQGESAYEANLYVDFPADLSYIALINIKNKTSNVICSPENDTLVVCSLGNPFQENRSAHLQLRFEVKSTNKQSVDIKAFVNSTSRELSDQTSQSLVVVLKKIALFTIDGKALTPNLLYSGTIRGESAMKNFEDIGDKVVHQYTITNNAQWQMHDLEVKIYWPYQVNSTRHQAGKWLLYLEKTPSIDKNSGGGVNYCSVEPLEAVNPLKLTSAVPETRSETLSTRKITESSETHTFQNSSSYSSSSSSHESSYGKLRRKRDVDDVIEPQTVYINGKKRDVAFMDCLSGFARCATITCKIPYLNKNDQIKIKVQSRIWNSTLIEDYSKVDWVNLTSRAEVIIPDETVQLNVNTTTKALVETIAYPDIVLADTNVNIWIIVGSVIAGILLLILLIFILYKCGFFKRNRVKDHTLSGNLQKQGEDQNLLKSNEGNS